VADIVKLLSVNKSS